MPQMNVVIVGAGIAGLALAAALRRSGVDVVVYEQAPRLFEVGAGVQLAPNATRLLHRLGLAEQLRTVAVLPQTIEMRRWNDGELLRRTPLGESCRDRFGAPYYTLHRADLHACLLGLSPPEQIRLNARCIGVTQTADSAQLRFADAASVKADLVVGADGIRSVVRKHLAVDTPRYSGQTIYRGLVPADRVPHLVAEPAVRLWLGPDQHCVCYPVSSGQQVSFGATVPAVDWREESWTARGTVGDLASRYQGWHPDVTRLIGAVDVVSRWALHDRESLDRLSHGRVVLIGDAAHPMLPFQAQGANQAIEDAAVLARCLEAASRDGLPAALRRYEQIRLPRTSRIQAESRAGAGTLHLADGTAQRLRDVAAGTSSGLDRHQWLFEYDAEGAVTAPAVAVEDRTSGRS
ncbi:FAD-dependent monooxygenase [Micromonospora sp. C95]|uniref:FAD-dependent monooxygenase n=1 Tax=Micromonospora sp. C95 TaxID=2824882 RepID=UPI001B36D876|nr:FAD-dependent monooxygenase [Micromonospora sp. C95]MBQ1023709.1 FAD-dependent monooxygenase [Micromonospora sp. C95]